MKLLLAEDEKELANALTAVLKINNYTVDTVYDGQEALNYLSGDCYDGAILDVMMPCIDGISVVKAVRAQKNTTPILLLTAKSELEDKVAGLDSGADDYLTKPFAMKELLARIRAITRRSADMTHSILQYGDLQLNRASYSLKCRENIHRLANKEYQIMEMLLCSPETIISTEKFMEAVWGWDSEADINVVWVYLSRLRKILSSLDSNVHISCSRGLGYYLEQSHD